MAGRGPERGPPPGVQDQERPHLVRVRLPVGLLPIHEPHAPNHRQRQEAEQDYRHNQPGNLKL